MATSRGNIGDIHPYMFDSDSEEEPTSTSRRLEDVSECQDENRPDYPHQLSSGRDDTAVVLVGAGVTAITHPLLYVKLLIQVGHEPLPLTVGTTVFGKRVLYLPGFFSYGERQGHIAKVDGKRGIFRGLSLRIVTSAISTMVRSKVRQQVELLKTDELQTSLRKVFNETTYEMIIQCLSKVATHPFHVAFMSVRCMAQFVGREVKYGGLFSCMIRIFKEEGVTGFYVGLIPHLLGEVLFLQCCNLLAHFINAYAVEESVSRHSYRHNAFSN
ncbi:mitochondrial carrier homolog 1-like [Echeneis naucrates]|uniref:mitochondrial carrier homolog 1-like n=1 Tax=Echeneis naucrates TaxID=173247 RepID=UPI001113D2B9|nr:mitochondrial carrier homolog 1-like [Echeneis naucrates]